MSLFDNPNYRAQDDLTAKVIEAVEKGYSLKRRPEAVVKKNSFSPSSIGYKHNRCPRLWAMKFAGRYVEKDRASLQSLGMMGGGTASHERIQSALEAAGVVEELEKEITYSDPPIRGFADVIAKFEDGLRAVIEVKTTRTEAFESRSHKMSGPSYQMYQLLIYLYVTGIKNGILLYENNNDKRLLAVPVTLDEKNTQIVEKALDWMREVWAAHEDDQLPERPWKQTSPNCQECPLFEACWTEPREDVKIKPMAVHAW